MILDITLCMLCDLIDYDKNPLKSDGEIFSVLIQEMSILIVRSLDPSNFAFRGLFSEV